jgi:hypothetical protein
MVGSGWGGCGGEVVGGRLWGEGVGGGDGQVSSRKEDLASGGKVDDISVTRWAQLPRADYLPP